ncbi:glycoside hydrolase family 43 protein [Salegentibacter sp. F188]|uniref:Glycoside hydrolase family 43 protein n=1 Tax=Autumnicola patrickiae TaxID=3075591 RepID=A0ABU3E4Q9_9FLAO|nr:glycoside hydrolase family 43 protein [Salegentibacter sp. F188]MDT0690983.1 glycoside hydrolase family 43 protein [Salegentibacter sp. F188]
MKLLKLSFALIFIFCGFTANAQEHQYDNPLALQRADPFVTKAEDGTYYFIATVPEYDRIEIRRSETINGIKEADPVVVWRKHEEGPMSEHIWAPELHRIDGKWYIYFAASEADDKWKLRMYALSNPSGDPTKGEWTEEGQIESNRDIFALDATTFEHEGQRYHIWTDRASDEVTNTGLFIAEMTSPTTLAEKQVVITQPEYDWEIQGHRVNEGPAVLIRNGKIFVTFSASATDHNYNIGLLWANQDADLLDPASWNKLPEPVFFTNEELKRYGPGHNSFTVAEDGVTVVMIYHARDYKEIDGEPLYDPNRNTHARVIKFTEDGMPYFGQELRDNEMANKELIKK